MNHRALRISCPTESRQYIEDDQKNSKRDQYEHYKSAKTQLGWISPEKKTKNTFEGEFLVRVAVFEALLVAHP